MAKTGGPWWLRRTRAVRRWWAQQRVWGKGGVIAGSLLALLFVLAAVLGNEERPAEGPGPGPTENSPVTANTPPTESPVGTASLPVPVRPDQDVPQPSNASTTSTLPEEVPLPPFPEATTPEPAPEESTAEPASAYYENCDEARAAGAAPLLLGEPGYRPGLDRNRDGVACEE
ncbi:excalibur calcium-binding domain-containing protein [Streptomyces narbonensis]|uniref:Excalibur calcium-binding domain-containing protein n=1 Tax=Streptomyces narbonensis TaxID=67333 RepID=A0ABV3CLX5_9ACTN